MEDKYALASHYFPKQKNFMTPDVVKRGKRGRFVYELSTGFGINYTGPIGSQGPRIWGVTVMDRYTGKNVYDLSTIAHSLDEAKEKIFHLRWIRSYDK